AFGLDRRGDLVLHLGRHLRVHGDAHQRLHPLTLRLPADVHRRDVDGVLAEDGPDLPDDAWSIHVVEEHHPGSGRDLDVEVIHVRDPFGVAGHDRPFHAGWALIGLRADRDEADVVLAHGGAHLAHGDATVP